MNYYKNKLNQIRVMLGMDVKMVESVLEDGVTKVETESLEPGFDLFVVSETGEKAPAPEGTHTLEDGTKVTVDAEGKITLVEKAEEPKVEIEVEAAEEVKVEEEVKGVPAEMVAKLVEEKIAEKIDEMMTKVYAALEEVVKDVTEVKEEMAAQKEKMAKLSKAPGASKISTFNTDVPQDSENTIEDRLEHLRKLKAEFGNNKRF
jgi:hypothetical protein